ncbi:hypothetical protein [Rhizobium sp. 9140]|uniref:hypothetical protein n=1 Tax=Rhizobium sp. 9140 TaxID=1761900 RepID=UPI0007957DC3|nr:hypothetical protein [Rhizobium sp. 9140]CZT34618.1 hypothetical protein GA0004734_00016350 [Rhizobium sp. 9140]
MAIFTVAGSKISIGAALPSKATDFVVADFASQTWQEVGNVETLGTFGDTSEETTFDDIGKARRQKLKGVRDAGTLEIVCGLDYSDAGQAALVAAEKVPHEFAIRVEFSDKPSGASPKNSIRYFVARIMSAAEALEAAGDVAKLNVSMSINSNIVRVAASAT